LAFTFKNWMQNRSMLAICLQTYSNIWRSGIPKPRKQG